MKVEGKIFTKLGWFSILPLVIFFELPAPSMLQNYTSKCQNGQNFSGLYFNYRRGKYQNMKYNGCYYVLLYLKNYLLVLFIGQILVKKFIHTQKNIMLLSQQFYHTLLKCIKNVVSQSKSQKYGHIFSTILNPMLYCTISSSQHVQIGQKILVELLGMCFLFSLPSFPLPSPSPTSPFYLIHNLLQCCISRCIEIRRGSI